LDGGSFAGQRDELWRGSICRSAWVNFEQWSVVAPVTLEFDKPHQRRLMRLNSLLARDGVQCGIDAREMVCGKVAHKRAYDFVVAHAAVQPAQEENELHAGENEALNLFTFP
jgi:hypothetical protein